MFYVVGIIIAFYLDALLISKKRKNTADKILAVWLFFIGIHLLLFYLTSALRYSEFPSLLGLGMPMPLLHGPFLYLYTSAATGRYVDKKEIALHFLPTLISYIFMINFFQLSNAEKISVFENHGKGYDLFSFVNLFAIILSGVVYTAWSMVLLRKHKYEIMNQFSYTEKIDLNWIRYLIYGIGAIWLVVIFINDDRYIFSTVVLFIIFLGYFGNRQVGIFTSVEPPKGPSEKPVTSVENSGDSTLKFIHRSNDNDGTSQADAESRKKYLKSGLSREASEAIHKRLLNVMNTEKIFADGELTLSTLAKKLDVHPNILSQVINEMEGKNFYDFINSYRIEEFKRLISDPQNQKFTILGLAYDCGFNSKSSFNRYFKKVTDVSPSEYLQRLSIREAS